MPLIRIDAIGGRSKERGVDVADLLLEQDHLVTLTTESPVAAVDSLISGRRAAADQPSTGRLER
jgi:hypothetical protein